LAPFLIDGSEDDVLFDDEPFEPFVDGELLVEDEPVDGLLLVEEEPGELLVEDEPVDDGFEDELFGTEEPETSVPDA